MNVLVCGSRDWDDEWIVRALLDGILDSSAHVTLIEGEARGADGISGKWADEREVQGNYVTKAPFKAAWPERGAPVWERVKAGHDRNQRMLDEGKPDVLIAFKDNLRRDLKKGGTEDMVRRARAAGIPCYVVSHANWEGE